LPRGRGGAVRGRRLAVRPAVRAAPFAGGDDGVVRHPLSHQQPEPRADPAGQRADRGDGVPGRHQPAPGRCLRAAVSGRAAGVRRDGGARRVRGVVARRALAARLRGGGGGPDLGQRDRGRDRAAAVVRRSARRGGGRDGRRGPLLVRTRAAAGGGAPAGVPVRGRAARRPAGQLRDPVPPRGDGLLRRRLVRSPGRRLRAVRRDLDAAGRGAGRDVVAGAGAGAIRRPELTGVRYHAARMRAAEIVGLVGLVAIALLGSAGACGGRYLRYGDGGVAPGVGGAIGQAGAGGAFTTGAGGAPSFGTGGGPGTGGRGV